MASGRSNIHSPFSGQVAVKRYRADSAADWHFTSDNPERGEIRLAKSSEPYPILGIFIANLHYS